MSRNGSQARRAALVANVHSRTGSRAFSEALDLLGKLGVPISATYPVRDPGRLPETVREVLDEGHDLLILGGGDGTVSSVVDFLVGHEVALGLLPLGTANDFARTLGIPFELEAACRAIADGQVVDVDLGLIGHNYYVNVASVGMSAGVTQALSPTLKKRAGKLAYSLATVSAFAKHRPFSARLTFPDGDHTPVQYHRLLQIAIGNGRFYGGGMVVSPESGIDDSALDVYAVERGRFRDLVDIARRIRSGDLLGAAGAHQFRTTRIHLETDPVMPVNVDGELVAHTPQMFSLARNALHVITPQGSSAARRDSF
ncbi:MAG: lipid kinase [Streptomycetales bacterium]